MVMRATGGRRRVSLSWNVYLPPAFIQWQITRKQSPCPPPTWRVCSQGGSRKKKFIYSFTNRYAIALLVRSWVQRLPCSTVEEVEVRNCTPQDIKPRSAGGVVGVMGPDQNLRCCPVSVSRHHHPFHRAFYWASVWDAETRLINLAAVGEVSASCQCFPVLIVCTFVCASAHARMRQWLAEPSALEYTG